MNRIFEESSAWRLDNKPRHADSKIELLSGAMIDAYPAASPKTEPCEENLFMQNAFFLLANSSLILSDSRMFLSPIGIQSGLAYCGTSSFRNPTLGIYIEWWMMCQESIVFPDKVNPQLVCRLSGSPLSGGNSCTTTGIDGNPESHFIGGFSKAWGTFAKINGRYKDFKENCEAYPLEKVIRLLKEDPRHNQAESFEAMALKHQSCILLDVIAGQRQKIGSLRSSVSKAQAIYHMDEIRPLYEELSERLSSIGKEIDLCRTLHKIAKEDLQQGLLTPKSAQKRIHPVLERKSLLLRDKEELLRDFARKLREIDAELTPEGAFAIFENAKQDKQ